MHRFHKNFDTIKMKNIKRLKFNERFLRTYYINNTGSRYMVVHILTLFIHLFLEGDSH